MPRNSKVPICGHHKTTGQARVRINGRVHWLGRYGSPEANARYASLIDDWRRRGNVEQATITVDDVALRFLAWAEGYYRKGDRPTSEVDIIRAALRLAVRLFGNTLACDFGPLKLNAVRDEAIRQRLRRKTINKYVSRIRAMFRWACELEYVAASVNHGLEAVKGLQAGRSAAVESEPVKPVSADAIEAVRPFVSRQVWGMIELQRLTGTRPGEIVSMRTGDIDRRQSPWQYIPREHKTEHRGKNRTIWIGPKAQAVLWPFLKADPAAWVFSPADAEDDRIAARRDGRKTPITPSQAARAPRANRRRPPGDHYTTASYRRAVERACEIAFDMPEELRRMPASASERERAQLVREAARWRKANAWRPNQLRHSAATDLRRRYGIEGARLILGHESGQTTEIYAEADLKRAQQIALEVG